MKTTARTTAAERIGRGLGCAWLVIRRQEVRMVQYMVRQGLSPGVATLILWAVKLLALGVMLYAAFWVALLLIFLVAAAWVARHHNWEDEEKPEWRNGLSGFGLYRGGIRIDPGGSDDE